MIYVTVPTGATTGNVVVTVGGVASNGFAFTVLTVPNITALSQNSGGVGVAMAVQGSNFGATQGSSTVTFNGTAATVSSWSNLLIYVTVPTGATTGNIVVTVGGVASNGFPFTVVGLTALQITSPASDTIFNPGGTIAVTVVSPSNLAITQLAVVGQGPIGVSGLATSVPAQLSISIPASIAPRFYALSAIGTTGSPPGVQSAPITIDVERPDMPVSLSATQSGLTFESQGESSPVQILGTFSDGSTLDVTGSSYVSYATNDSTIASVDATGIVTAIGAGNTWISATYVQGGQFVRAFVNAAVLPFLLTGSPSPLTFGNQTTGGSSSGQHLTLSNAGTAPLIVTTVAAGGDFSETDNCVSSSPIPAGGTCTITVIFTPSIVGLENGVVSISTKSQTIPTQISLMGTGTAPTGP